MNKDMHYHLVVIWKWYNNCFAVTNCLPVVKIVTLLLVFVTDHIPGWTGLFRMRHFSTVGAHLTMVDWSRLDAFNCFGLRDVT